MLGARLWIFVPGLNMLIVQLHSLPISQHYYSAA